LAGILKVLRIGESLSIDSEEMMMPKSYSRDLRERVIGAVEAGASCHEVAAAFEVSPSSAIRWVARWRQTGSAAKECNNYLSAKTVGELRKVTAWPDNLVIATPQERHSESAVRVSKASVATRVTPKP